MTRTKKSNLKVPMRRMAKPMHLRHRADDDAPAEGKMRSKGAPKPHRVKAGNIKHVTMHDQTSKKAKRGKDGGPMSLAKISSHVPMHGVRRKKKVTPEHVARAMRSIK